MDTQKVKFQRITMTVKDYLDNWYNEIDCQPLAQRLPVTEGPEKREGIIDAMPDYEKKFLNIASKYVKITSINLNGDSINIPSILYSNFTGKKPKYRENTELVDISILKKMSKCSAFKIF